MDDLTALLELESLVEEAGAMLQDADNAIASLRSKLGEISSGLVSLRESAEIEEANAAAEAADDDNGDEAS